MSRFGRFRRKRCDYCGEALVVKDAFVNETGTHYIYYKHEICERKMEEEEC